MKGIRKSRRRGVQHIAIGCFVLLAIASAVMAFVHGARSYAATVPESCFTFSAGTITAYDPSSDPACVKNVTVPQTIGGQTVTTIGGGSFSGKNLTAIHFPSTITSLQSGALAGNSALVTVDLQVSGNLDIQPSAFTNFTGSDLTISAGGDLTIASVFTSAGTSPSATPTLHLEAGHNLTLTNGSFTGGTYGAMELTAGNAVLIQNSTLQSITAPSLTIDAQGSIVLTNGALEILAVPHITIQSETSSVAINSGTVQGTGVESMDIKAADGLTIGTSGANGLPNLESLSFTLGGDVTIADNAFSATKLSGVTLSTNGSLTIASSAFSQTPLLTSADLTAGGNMNLASGAFYDTSLESVNAMATGSILVDYGVFSDTPLLAQAEFHAGGALTLNGGSLTNTGLESLTLEAGGPTTIGMGVLSNNKLKSVSLPATTVSIGKGSFRYTDLETVYLNTPTIDNGTDPAKEGVFGCAGVTDGGSPGGDFTNVRYVQLYTLNQANPAGYIDTDYGTHNDPSYGCAGHRSGGILVNPATSTVRYTAGGTDLRSSVYATGYLSNGTRLTNYVVSANPAAELSAYFHAGGTYTVEAPAIASYSIPSSKTGTYGAGLNIITFVYVAASPSPTPTTGSSSARSSARTSPSADSSSTDTQDEAAPPAGSTEIPTSQTPTTPTTTTPSTDAPSGTNGISPWLITGFVVVGLIVVGGIWYLIARAVGRR